MNRAQLAQLAFDLNGRVIHASNDIQTALFMDPQYADMFRDELIAQHNPLISVVYQHGDGFAVRFKAKE